MKRLLTALTAIALLGAASTSNEMLQIGEKAPMPDYKMKDVSSGEKLSLSDLTQENGLLVIFSCNTCPFVLGWEDQFPKLAELSEKNNIGMVLVNSNEGKRSDEDSEEAMRNHYVQAGYNSPYVIDDKHKLADAFGAKTTPHVYLFNSDLELVYRGSINDKYEKRGEEPENFYLVNALNALAKGEKITPAETRQMGCSIKRVKV